MKSADLPEWTFLTNHAHVLVFLASHPEEPLRVAAEAVGITERAVQRIVSDLEAAGIVERHRMGRQNRYRLRLDVPLRHPLEHNCTVGDVVSTLVDCASRPPSGVGAQRSVRQAGE